MEIIEQCYTITSSTLRSRSFLFLLLCLLTACSDTCYTCIEGVSKSSKPYCIYGEWYYPQAHYDYSEAGVASWYGPRFHGRPNACGYRFNKYKFTAAHRTLPLPTIARVTNLHNGASLIVLIDDRGPFIDPDNRLIDLSYAAAKALGILEKGVASVHIESLTEESRQFSNYIAAYYQAYGRQARLDWVKLFEQQFYQI